LVTDRARAQAGQTDLLPLPIVFSMADIKKRKLVIFLIGSTLLITFTFYGYQIVFTPNILVDRDDRVFFVKKGATFHAVQQDLYRGNFVNDPVSFSFLARWMDYDKSIKPGRAGAGGHYLQQRAAGERAGRKDYAQHLHYARRV
jgi:hypothetical protein